MAKMATQAFFYDTLIFPLEICVRKWRTYYI